MVTPTLRKIVRVPEEFAKRDRSTSRLLEDIGFPEARDVLKTQDVEQALRDEPCLTDLWLKRGKDQRYAGGWGIECLGGKFTVVSYADGRKARFEDRFKASADFIVRYLCFIGDVQARVGQRSRPRQAAC